MELTINTVYGDLTVRDAMIDTDGTNLTSGVVVTTEDGQWLCELSGFCADSFDCDPEALEELIDIYV